MSIEVQCPGCGRTYRTADQFAGRQVKCKACGSTMTVPAAAPDDFGEIPLAPAMPPPLPPRYTVPPLPLAVPDYSRRLQPPPSAPRSNAVLIVVACVAGALVLLLAIGGWGVYSFVKRVRGPAAMMSDATVSSRLIGVWSGTQSHPRQAPVWAEMTLKADGTGRMRFSGQGKVADADITWLVNSHIVRITFVKIHVGNPSSVGTSFLIGRVKAVSPTRLIMATQYGDEFYSPSARAGAQPPTPFPPIPSRGINALTNRTFSGVHSFGNTASRLRKSPRIPASLPVPPSAPAAPPAQVSP